jgi:hypothetical protein
LRRPIFRWKAAGLVHFEPWREGLGGPFPIRLAITRSALPQRPGHCTQSPKRSTGSLAFVLSEAE